MKVNSASRCSSPQLSFVSTSRVVGAVSNRAYAFLQLSFVSTRTQTVQDQAILNYLTFVCEHLPLAPNCLKNQRDNK